MLAHQDIAKNTLPIPAHYDPEQVGRVWRVPYQARAAEALEWAAAHGIQPAAEDRFRLALILIDVQNTFCIPEFELFVAGASGMGAVEDNRRLCEFIYRNLSRITHITATLDTHRAVQIFHPVFLVDRQGRHPDPLTLISLEDVRRGRWRFNEGISASLGITPEAGQRHLLHYTQELARQGKYDLTIWPYHAMLGGIGHALTAAVEEAIFFHGIARSAQAELEMKGELAITENYSAIGPEVLTGANGEILAQKTEGFLQKVLDFDAVVIAGQAKSHCVAWTVEDLLIQIQAHEPALAQKVFLLEDCASPVVVPGIVDYSRAAEQAYSRFEQAGMRRVLSTQPLSEWPGLGRI